MNDKMLVVIVCIISLVECIIIPLISWLCFKHDCKKYGKNIMEKWRDNDEGDTI